MASVALPPPPPAVQPPARWPLGIQVLNNFTWLNPTHRFSFEADGVETGDELRRRLAAHIGYLAVDILVLRGTQHLSLRASPSQSGLDGR